jgi:transcriptional regulator with XRE-family HTH domain
MKYDKRSVRRLRRERGLEIAELAKKAKLAQRTVYYLDRGLTVPRADTLAALAGVFGVGVEAFYVTLEKAS